MADKIVADASALPPALAMPAGSGLEPDQKAAIVVYSMGPERAEKLLRRMDERDHRRFARAMNRLGVVDAEVVDAVTGEFANAIDDRTGIRGGMLETRRFMARFLDETAVATIMEEIGEPAGRDIWEKLSNAPEQMLFSYLSNEQPQSAAVILSRLRPGKAAKVLEMFSEDHAKAVVLRMTRMGAIGPQVLQDLKATLQEDFLSGFRERQAGGQPDVLITGMLNEMSQDRVASILSALQVQDRDLAEKVQKKLFIFPDFPSKIGSVDLQTVIKNCERDTLILALAYAKRNSPDVVEYFFTNMSKRVAEQMQEEIDGAGPIRLKDAEAAQQEIVRLTQALVKSGEIRMLEQEEDEQQVL